MANIITADCMSRLLSYESNTLSFWYFDIHFSQFIDSSSAAKCLLPPTLIVSSKELQTVSSVQMDDGNPYKVKVSNKKAPASF